MANIFSAAKYILQKAGPMSGIKLQKICYYAQAWSLVWDDEELFSEDFEAWANGPVCPELFNWFDGKFKVCSDDIPDSHCSGSLSGDQIDTIDRVVEFYAVHDAQWLSTLTHMEDPWRNARKGVAVGDPCTNIITKDSMSAYYGGI